METSDTFEFTGDHIEVVTGGYVNSGVRRQWIAQGRLTTGPRRSAQGGARLFTFNEVLKAAFMGRFRQTGASLDDSQKWATGAVGSIDSLISAFARDGSVTIEQIAQAPLYFVVNHANGTIAALTVEQGKTTRLSQLHDDQQSPALSTIDGWAIVQHTMETLQSALEQASDA
jgi:DNA-binding transcriptional MerR regulator